MILVILPPFVVDLLPDVRSPAGLLLSFALPLAVALLSRPRNFFFLTYWTLSLHAAALASRILLRDTLPALFHQVLHGASLAGSISVFVGYAVLCVGGTIKYGSWFRWETRPSPVDGSPAVHYGFAEVLLRKVLEHLWPPVALMFVDAAANKKELEAYYEGTSVATAMIMAIIGYAVVATTWELACAAAVSDTLEIYGMPRSFRTSSVLGTKLKAKLGVAEDFCFATSQKLLMVASTVLGYAYVVQGFI